MEPFKPAEKFAADVAHIGKSVIIKGELSGSEDLFLDGEVEGNIDLQDHNLTIGPHGRVRANVRAKDVVIHGKVDGNVQGTDRVELKRSAVLAGDIATQLNLSHGTVRNYLSEAIGKLGVANRIEAYRMARQKGWL